MAIFVLISQQNIQHHLYPNDRTPLALNEYTVPYAPLYSILFSVRIVECERRTMDQMLTITTFLCDISSSNYQTTALGHKSFLSLLI